MPININCNRIVTNETFILTNYPNTLDTIEIVVNAI